MKVAILGCGPAGLLAAHAVDQAGHMPVIYSRKTKSEIPGSMHLHGPVSEITSFYPEGTIQFIRIGTAAGYAQKVYGDPTRETGWVNYTQVFPSWNVIRAYDKLWERYEHQILDTDVTAHTLRVLSLSSELVISTLPSPQFCMHEHSFESSPYWIRKLPLAKENRGWEVVVYNGLESDLWYRWSILGDLCSIESTKPIWPNDPDVTEGQKAIGTNCDCWPRVTRVGRWAEWRHGVVLYHVYQKVAELMKGAS